MGYFLFADNREPVFTEVSEAGAIAKSFNNPIASLDSDRELRWAPYDQPTYRLFWNGSGMGRQKQLSIKLWNVRKVLQGNEKI